MKYLLRQASSFMAPVVICIILPYFIVAGRSVPVFARSPLLFILGAGLCLAGLAGFILTARMFIHIGRGTIMPWDPTSKLITGSLYGYVRNPMISSVLLIVFGEALMFASTWLAVLAALFFVINTLYFFYSEEPGLEKRFGQEYREYKKNVPRWIPRRSP